jgi:hypothetical protein
MRLGSENRLDGIQNFGLFGSVFSKPFPTRQTLFRTGLLFTTHPLKALRGSE